MLVVTISHRKSESFFNVPAGVEHNDHYVEIAGLETKKETLTSRL